MVLTPQDTLSDPHECAPMVTVIVAAHLPYTQITHIAEFNQDWSDNS